ncbi:ABC transporter ATP-binding protein [Rhodoligotrophos defluvii]|uniref:ABC transporter ATP-binding protein n=1 Tax=Rhodoligotrophos defluvii TaxID=2561934 RepID=UPI0010C96207|nr:ABC transporter ATP-binding protein [Rhodoligotrophos defluvii]
MRGSDTPVLGEQAGKSIEIIDVSKNYGTFTALENINFAIASGEFVSIVGPSGCGKSTLLRILAGLSPPTRGKVLINGDLVTEPRRDIGIVFQTPLLFEWRTVLDNTLLPVDVQRLGRARNTEKARELLALVGLSDFESYYPKQLSGGMQQRVGIARALVHDPAMLLMDEPFGALDAMTREKMNLELKRIWEARRKTIVFITHSIPEAVFLGERVVVLAPRPGRIADVLEVDLPRDRGLDIMNTDRFGSYVRRIRAHFGSSGGID